MNSEELRDHLRALELSRDETATLLQVSTRTVKRWLDGEEIPGPVTAAFRAWRSLHDRHLAWKPDSISVHEKDADQIERQRKYAVDFDGMLKRVERRGGPTHPWKVDADRSRATFGACEVNFHKLANGGFSVGSYRRTDRSPNLEKDMPLIEDAAYCIAREFARFGERGQALRDMATYVRANASLSVRDGAKMASNVDMAKSKRQIERLADQLEELATWAASGSGSYLQYEDIEEKLHACGFFPLDSQVAAVARAFA